jgi:hypothetical protein
MYNEFFYSYIILTNNKIMYFLEYFLNELLILVTFIHKFKCPIN